VAAGNGHTCATRADHTLWCWGTSINGALGLGEAILSVYTPTQLGTDQNWDKPASKLGRGHSCALKTDRTLWCWGDNRGGELGLGDTEPRWTPAQAPGRQWTEVAASDDTCGLKQDRTLWCWGGMPPGSSDAPIRTSPVPVPGRWLQISPGLATCGIRIDHTLWCWGWNSSGQLGLGGHGVPGATEQGRHPALGAGHHQQLQHLRDPRRRLAVVLGQQHLGRT
jgi:alpha-tubulin suppressor-like RCC1 family protein